MAKFGNSEGAGAGEGVTVKKLTGAGPGPSMKVPGDGAITKPLNRDWVERCAAKHADALGGIVGGPAVAERVSGKKEPGPV